MSYYEVQMDGKKIYDPSYKEMVLLNASVSIGAGEAGSFDFTFPRNHIFIDSIVPYGSTIEVFEDSESIFYGRPLPATVDVFRQKRIHCEGALAFLNDVICPVEAPGLNSAMDDGQYFRYLINYYNSQQIRSDRRIMIGTAPTGGVSRVREWSYRSCMEELRNNILPYTGGILLTRRTNGVTYIDWVNEFTDTNNQPIMIGMNLLDVSRTGQQFYTTAIASGGVNAEGKTVVMNEAIKMSAEVCGKYGNICAYLSFPNVTTVAELKARCALFLTRQQFDKFTVNADSIDMHIVNDAYERLAIGKKANIKFEDIDVALTMPITKIDVDIISGKKTVTIASADWMEKKQYVKNEYKVGSLTEMQGDFGNIKFDYDALSLELVDSEIKDAILMKDPVSGLVIALVSTFDVDTNEWELVAVVIPDALELRKKYGEYSVGDTIYGDLIRTTPGGDVTELTEYTYLATDTVTVGHSNGTIDQYGTGQTFTYYYGDTLSIETQEGDFITMKTYEIDGVYGVGDEFDSADFDAFLVYGDGTEVKTTDVAYNIDDGYEFQGNELDPQTVKCETTKLPTTTKTSGINVDGLNVNPISSVGSIDVGRSWSDTLETGLNGQGKYLSYIRFSRKKDKYTAGDTFYLADYDVSAHYSDDSEEIITSECNYSMEDGYQFVPHDPHYQLISTYTKDDRTYVAAAMFVVRSPDRLQFVKKRDTFIVSSTLLYSDYEVDMVYDNGDKEDVTSSCTFNIADQHVFTAEEVSTSLPFVATYYVAEETYEATCSLKVASNIARRIRFHVRFDQTGKTRPYTYDEYTGYVEATYTLTLRESQPIYEIHVDPLPEGDPNYANYYTGNNVIMIHWHVEYEKTADGIKEIAGSAVEYSNYAHIDGHMEWNVSVNGELRSGERDFVINKNTYTANWRNSLVQTLAQDGSSHKILDWSAHHSYITRGGIIDNYPPKNIGDTAIMEMGDCMGFWNDGVVKDLYAGATYECAITGSYEILS